VAPLERPLREVNEGVSSQIGSGDNLSGKRIGVAICAKQIAILACFEIKDRFEGGELME